MRSARLPARAPVRVRSARVAQLLGVAVAPDAIADIFTRLRLPFTREAATTSSSRRRRTASTSPSRRTSSRKSRAFTATTRFPRRRAAHVQTMLPVARGAAQRVRVASACSSLATGRKSITFSFVARRRRACARPGERTADRGAESHRRASRRHAHDAAAAACIERAADQPQAQAVARSRVRGRPRASRDDGFAQPLRIGGLAFGSSAPEQWGERTRGVDLFDVKGDLEALAAPLALATTETMHPVAASGPQSRAVRVERRTVGLARRTASASRAPFRSAHARRSCSSSTSQR